MAKENVKKDNKNKKHFWKDFKAELKRVIWPTPKQLFKNTIAVIFIVLVTATIVFFLDLTFDALNKKGINKLKSAITSSVVSENSDEEAEAVEEDDEDATEEDSEEAENSEDAETENDE